MKYRSNKIIYSINVTDLQTVSNRVLQRSLTNKEVAVIQDSVGDFVDWFGSIESAIYKHVDQNEMSTPVR
jgi:hypothetical protein